MMRLRMTLDQLTAPIPGGIGRFSRELAVAMLECAPAGWDVEGALTRVGDVEVARVEAAVPGLAAIHRTRLPRRLAAEAWRRGVGVRPTGPRASWPHAVFAPSLFAPLGRSCPPTVVTIHDCVPWTRPETLTPRGAAWHRDMGARAAQFAEVITTPTQAVADAVSRILEPRGRVLVVPGAPSGALTAEDAGTASRIAADLHLPGTFILAVGTLEPRKRLTTLIRALAHPDLRGAHLVVAGPDGWGGVSLAEVAARAGVDGRRIHALGHVTDEALAALYRLASVFVMPSVEEGFGLPVVEAMRAGCPVVISSDPALVEVAGGAGLVVPDSVTGDEYEVAERFATVVGEVLGSCAEQQRMRDAGTARAGAFSWRSSAEKAWSAVSFAVGGRTGA